MKPNLFRSRWIVHRDLLLGHSVNVSRFLNELYHLTSPKGRPENSPAFQRREQAHRWISPGGTLKGKTRFNRPSGTEYLLDDEPGIEMPGYYQMFLRNRAK